jgi:hypothetical protein
MPGLWFDRARRERSGSSPLWLVWRVETTFAQLGRWRRLSRSFEQTRESAEAWLEVALRLHARADVAARLAPSGGDGSSSLSENSTVDEVDLSVIG